MGTYCVHMCHVLCIQIHNGLKFKFSQSLDKGLVLFSTWIWWYSFVKIEEHFFTEFMKWHKTLAKTNLEDILLQRSVWMPVNEKCGHVHVFVFIYLCPCTLWRCKWAPQKPQRKAAPACRGGVSSWSEPLPGRTQGTWCQASESSLPL